MLWSHRLCTVTLPRPASVLIAFVAVEFAYWAHRCGHTWRWCHAFGSSFVRAHDNWRRSVFGCDRRHCGRVALAYSACGPRIQGVDLFGLLPFNLACQFCLHTELIPKLGPIEWIFNTPSYHRVHHASNKELLDRNFGGTNRFRPLFGTLAVPDDTVPLQYGLFRERRGFNPLTIAFGGWWFLLRTQADSHGARIRLRPA